MTDILIFDRQRVRMNKNRASRNPGHDFLHDWAGEQLSLRLHDVKRNFAYGLWMGASGSRRILEHPKIETKIIIDHAEGFLRQSGGLRIQGDEEVLPFGPESLDLILSCLSLHTVNDLPGALVQARQALKPDGLFMAAMLGGETLHELRQVMNEAEIAVRGGISPRIAPFADKPQMGDLLQRAGFSLPVVDSDIVTVTYDNAFRLFHDLRMMGEGNAILNRDKSIPPRALFMEAARLYQEKFSESDGRIKATFEIIFLAGWSPHESQQKPLKPGSATFSLADALGA
jgi:NADH dehydrogenase [ubiquinone] 1 alpha subcomplex assembly factor 5